MTLENKVATLLASASHTETTTTDAQANPGYRGIMLILDVTTGGTGETLTPQVEVYIPASDTWEPITAFSATASAYTGEKVYVIYPGAVETAAIADQEIAAIPVPLTWRVKVTHSGSEAWVYSLTCYWVL